MYLSKKAMHYRPFPWLSHFWPQVKEAISHYCEHLLLNRSKWQVSERRWVAKVSNALSPVSRAYIIAGLGAERGTSHSWGDKVKGPGNFAR